MTFTKTLEYGGHALVWSGDWTPEGARKAISGELHGQDMTI